MDIQRLIAFVIFSFSALLLWDAWQKHNAPKVPAPPAVVAGAPAAPGPGTTPTPTMAAPGAPPAVAAAPAAPVGAPVEATGQPIVVRTDLFEVELNSVGGDIRRVKLFKVYSALDRSKALTLLSADPKQYFVTQTGLLGEGLPSHKAVYQAEAGEYELASGQDRLEVRLVAKGAEGVEVVKKFVFRRGTYEMEVSYEVKNVGATPISPFAYFQFLRDGNQPSQEAAQTSAIAGVATFTGPAVYTDELKFVKVDFKDIEKGKQTHARKAKDGWIGVVQHYFVSAWLPKPSAEREYFTNKVGENLYTAGVIVPVGSIAPGASATVAMPLYIGPQNTDRLAKIAPGLELVVDYGWLYILAAPLFWVLKFIHGMVGNWGWAIILLTILIKLVFYPLNHKAGRSMAAMKVLGPKMEKLKQLYGNDKQKLNQAMMELYRTEKINPLGGCLPIVVQIPVFIALYWVLLGSIELRHAPWLGWIQDLSAPDPFYILPVIYAISMFVQTKLNPQPTDPVQAKVMLAMPIVFSIFFLFFPAGLVLYWVVQNLLSIAQQWHINRTLVAEAAAKAKGKH
ncbi:MAG: membrane protein insertase YidC [Betaproteobacteria bacterium]|nr:membrane protein insertase YidC [Betaproteobacteria bacterium]